MYLQKFGNKYRAQSQIYNNVAYHSKFEAAYAHALDVSLKSGEIKSWERQVRLDLKVNGKHWTNYYIDFVIIHNDGSKEYVECKGFATPVWELKWKLFEIIFEREFKEHPDDSMTVIKQSSWGPPKPRKSKEARKRRKNY